MQMIKLIVRLRLRLLYVWDYYQTKRLKNTFKGFLCHYDSISKMSKNCHYCLVYPHYLADISFIAFSFNVLSSDFLATWLCFKMSLLPPSSLLNLCKFSPSQLDHPVYHYIVPIPHPTSTLLVFFILLSFFSWHMLHSNIPMTHTSYFHLVSTLQNANSQTGVLPEAFCDLS